MNKYLVALLITLISYNPAFAFTGNSCILTMADKIHGSELNMENCNVQDSDIPAINSFLRDHQNIAVLNLKHNKITAKGLGLLVSKSTSNILVQDNQINDLDEKALAHTENTSVSLIKTGNNLIAVKAGKSYKLRTRLTQNKMSNKALTTTFTVTNKTDVYEVMNQDGNPGYCIKPSAAIPVKIATNTHQHKSDSDWVYDYELQPGIPTPIKIAVEDDGFAGFNYTMKDDRVGHSYGCTTVGGCDDQEVLIVSTTFQSFNTISVMFQIDDNFYRVKAGALPDCSQ